MKKAKQIIERLKLSFCSEDACIYEAQCIMCMPPPESDTLATVSMPILDLTFRTNTLGSLLLT